MTTTLKPETPAQVTEAVAWAMAEEQPLEVVGAGSKRGLGRPVQAAHTLDLSALSGITLYEPEELVMSAGAGTPMAEIEARLAEQRQQLAFEPADYGPLLGSGDGAAGTGGTIGGVLACNLAGPRRIKAGAARDHFLGLKAVSGRGEAFKAGGRVVKNVTGYDMCKLMAGSYGTLAVLTDVTVKVLPAPEKTRTVLLAGLDDGAAVRALAAALNSSHEVSAAAHLPLDAAARSGVSTIAGMGAAVTAVRVEGPGRSVAYRCKALGEMFASHGVVEELHSMNSAAFWRDIRDVAPFVPEAGVPGEGAQENGDRLVWRLSVPPSDGPSVVAEIARATPAEAFYDWGGGLVWLRLPAVPGAAADTVRRAVAATGGHATLVRAPADIRAAVAVFEPEDTATAMLTRRLKENFDPKGILNPGRMSAGG